MKRLTSLVISTLLTSTIAFQTTTLAQSTLSYSDISVHFRNGQEHFESRNYEACRAELAQYLEADRTFLEKEDANKVWAEYYLVKCSLYLNYSDTELLASRFVRNYPEHPIAATLFTEIGNYFYDQGDYARAVDYLSKSPKSNEEAQYRLGISHFTLQNYREALNILVLLKADKVLTLPQLLTIQELSISVIKNMKKPFLILNKQNFQRHISQKFQVG